MRPSRRTPLLRGFAAASTATFVALASHVWVDGAMPGVLGIAVPWLLSLMVCTLLAGRRLSLVRLGISVALSQLLFHALFVLGGITPRSGFAPHQHGIVALSTTPDGLVPTDAGMWGAHVVAAVVTVAALHRGERILRALVAAASVVRAWLTRVCTAPVPAARITPARPAWAVVPAPRRRAPHLGRLRHRGPPLPV
ncbi:hypothetical protein [Microbacterium sp.]|uniref:hypothetical protein n=1 Tax=Microbacterium sp. TaxID=51671 RepID=UPI00281262DE|nr:hypothetical protein [Microbacterium sp.]